MLKLVKEEGKAIASPLLGAPMSKYKGLTPEERRAQYRKDRAMIEEARLKQIPFLDSHFKLRMGVTVIGGCTGRGKSTANANILAYFFDNCPGKQALVITNEEVSSDVLDRVACVLLGQNFYFYRDGLLDESTGQRIQRKSDELLERIEVVSSTSVDMSCLEDVIEVLKYAQGRPDINLVLVDYLQTVNWMRENSEATMYEVSKKLGTFLKEYGRTVTIPVVIFAQMKPSSKEDADFAGRIQGDRTFVNHAAAAIEIIPDFEERTTRFLIQKDRFSSKQGQSLLYNWIDGRLERAKTQEILAI